MVVMGGGTSPYFGRCSAGDKKWNLSDLRFCNNEGSKRSKNNEKGGQQDRKSKGKLIQNSQMIQLGKENMANVHICVL